MKRDDREVIVDLILVLLDDAVCADNPCIALGCLITAATVVERALRREPDGAAGVAHARRLPALLPLEKLDEALQLLVAEHAGAERAAPEVTSGGATKRRTAPASRGGVTSAGRDGHRDGS